MAGLERNIQNPRIANLSQCGDFVLLLKTVSFYKRPPIMKSRQAFE